MHNPVPAPQELPEESRQNGANNAEEEEEDDDEEEGGSRAGEKKSEGLLRAVSRALGGNQVMRFLTQYPAWQQKRKLAKLEAAADASPTDANRQLEYLAQLNRVR